MAEAIFAGAVLAIALRWISRSAKEPDGFVRYFSRGAYMRDLNSRMKDYMPLTDRTNERR